MIQIFFLIRKNSITYFNTNILNLYSYLKDVYPCISVISPFGDSLSSDITCASTDYRRLFRFYQSAPSHQRRKYSTDAPPKELNVDSSGGGEDHNKNKTKREKIWVDFGVFQNDDLEKFESILF